MPKTTYDAVIVGAGFAGLYMLHRLRKMGLNVRVFEAGDGIGGTWYWNRYPGARCDVESMQYSYSFLNELQQDWKWSERFASQPEILSYANHVADRLDLRRDIQFNTRIDGRHLRRSIASRWTSAPTRAMKPCRRNSASWRPAACRTPACRTSQGLESFSGKTYHTGAMAA